MPTDTHSAEPVVDPVGHLAWQLRDQAASCAAMGSELYDRLLRAAADDVEAGGPCLSVLEPHLAPGRGDALALRFMAAVHRRVLRGGAPTLAQFYPSVGGTSDGGDQVFLDEVGAHVSELRAATTRPCQTNEVGRAAGLAGGFLLLARRWGMPLRLLEVGASAGLNLRWDHFRFSGGGATWGPSDSPVDLDELWAVPPPVRPQVVEVTQRRGCDPAPVDLDSEDGRLGVQASIWADQTERFARLAGAIQVAARVPAQIDRASADEWIGAQVAHPVPGVVTVVFQSVVDEYLSDEVRARFGATMAEAGARASSDAPLAWLRLEPDSALRSHAVELTSWPEAETVTLARCGAHGQGTEWLDGG